jgi:hypothetical protein
MTIAISPAVTLDSHDAPLPCSLCGGAMTAQDDLDVCVCGSRRVRSQPSVSNVVTTTKLVASGPPTAKIADGPSPTETKASAASRDDSIRNLHAELLHMLQEMTGISDAWCVAEMARLDVVLGQTEKVK